MAHFAQIDENNIVVRVIVVSNEHAADGENWCNQFLGGQWKQTSYSGNLRKNFAGIGYTYDAARDAFVPPKPFSSWVLNETTCRWDAPLPYPSDGELYSWDEVSGSWVQV
jgi:hypothetical protein